MTATNAETAPARKARIRELALARRDGLSPSWRAEASARLAAHADAIPVGSGQVVSGFWPIRSEIDPRRLMDALAARGAVLALPVVIDRRTIVFRRFDAASELVAGGFGTMAPGPEAETVDPDVMLVPLAAFDTTGNRIGYGAGHYDRAVAALVARGREPPLIGIAFDCQRVEAIAAEAHDVPLDTVLTETGLYRCGSRG